MAKYDKETKFYWLQLKEDFFEEDSIEWLEDQENGHKYSLFYLKLCLKSLKSNGVLIRKVGNMLVPYDNKKIAEMTRTPLDTVIVAMELLKGIGLVQVLEDGALYITQLENMVGSTSKGALKKQQQRALQKEKEQLLLGEEDDERTKGGQMSTKDKDKDKVKIKDIDIDKKKIERKKSYGEYKNVKLLDKELQSLKSSYGDDLTDELIIYLDEYIEMKGYKAKSHYLCIKKWVVDAVKEKKGRGNIKQPIRQEIVPEWLGKEVRSEALTDSEKEEMDSILKKYKDDNEEDDFEKRKKALQERLKNKYGPSASKEEQTS